MISIDINHIPTEPTVDILNPDGSVLITTNNVTTFNFIRKEIKKKNLTGFSVRNSDGVVIPIDNHGRIANWDKLPGEVYEKILSDLLR